MSIARRFASVDTPAEKPASRPSKAEPLNAPAEKPKGRGGRKKSPTSEATLKPWIAEGISRHTWYIRKRERKLFEEGRKAGLSEKKSDESDDF